MSQTIFAKAVLNPDAPVPEGVIDPDGNPTPKRFAVYRNNVAVSLTEALEQAFPALQSLIGPTRFKALAGLYLRAHPPRDPRMMVYGDGMADFLPQVTQLAAYPYLADVARLEQAIRESYHAADAAPLDPARLASLPPEAIADTRLLFAPAVRLVSSPYPALSIRARALDPEAPKPTKGAQSILVTRPEFDPVPHLIDQDQAHAIAALMNGAPLGEALASTDPNALLALLLGSAALTDLE